MLPLFVILIVYNQHSITDTLHNGEQSGERHSSILEAGTHISFANRDPLGGSNVFRSTNTVGNSTDTQSNTTNQGADPSVEKLCWLVSLNSFYQTSIPTQSVVNMYCIMSYLFNIIQKLSPVLRPCKPQCRTCYGAYKPWGCLEMALDIAFPWLWCKCKLFHLADMQAFQVWSSINLLSIFYSLEWGCCEWLFEFEDTS